ncbi:MAG: hypothetical protein MUC52_03255 [Candidatus Omnitrophica bacterium]|jgi:hypothetical protein|nr:hypothetical protein [Candidatus Omnitrophota bacterium]
MKAFRHQFVKTAVAPVIFLCVVVSLCGCEAFARKFTRKPKKKEQPVQNMVLSPEAYDRSGVSKSDAYRQYYTYWSSWHDELIDSLSDFSPSMRRQLDCVKEAVNNLAEMKNLLPEDKKSLVDQYLRDMAQLKADISQDLYSNNSDSNLVRAERIKRDIMRSLQYNNVKDLLQ